MNSRVVKILWGEKHVPHIVVEFSRKGFKNLKHSLFQINNLGELKPKGPFLIWNGCAFELFSAKFNLCVWNMFLIPKIFYYQRVYSSSAIIFKIMAAFDSNSTLFAPKFVLIFYIFYKLLTPSNNCVLSLVDGFDGQAIIPHGRLSSGWVSRKIWI